MPLGTPGVLLGAHGLFLGGPGMLLGAPGVLQGCSWVVLGCSWVLPGCSGGLLGLAWGLHGATWGLHGVCVELYWAISTVLARTHLLARIRYTDQDPLYWPRSITLAQDPLYWPRSTRDEIHWVIKIIDQTFAQIRSTPGSTLLSDLLTSFPSLPFTCHFQV